LTFISANLPSDVGSFKPAVAVSEFDVI